MFVKYVHQGAEVWCFSELKGKHREHCLCHRCKKFTFEREKNCHIANILYALCVLCNLTTPVYECPKFEEK